MAQIEENNKKQAAAKKPKLINPDEDPELIRLNERVENCENAKENKPHPLILGIRPEDIYIKGDTSDARVSSLINLECDLSELLGHERIVYAYINEDRVIIKINAKREIKQGDNAEYCFDLDAVHLFDEETGENIILSVKEEQ